MMIGKHILTLALAFVIAVSVTPEPVPAAEKVILQLSWDHQFQFAGYYAAQWQGFNADAGLEVEIRSGITADRRILDGVQEVAAGRADFGIGGADILVARDRGVPLVVCAAVFQHSPTEFYALRSLEINSLADLIGHRVGRKAQGLADIELKAMLAAEGIDPEKIPPYPQTPGLEQLIQGDVVAGSSFEFPFLAHRLGLALASLSPATYGVDFYGDSIFTRQSLATEAPGRVDRFVKASLKGWEYALNHPREIAERISRELDRTDPVPDPEAFNRFQIEGVRDLCMYPVVELGHINPDRWRRMNEILREAGLVQKDLDLKSFIFDPARQARERAEKRIWWQRVGLWFLLGISVLALLSFLLLRRRHRLLREKEERLRTLFDSIHEGILVHRPDGTVIFCNDLGRSMYGLVPEEADIKYSIADLSSPGPSLDRIPKLIRETLEKGQCGPFDWKAKRPHDGSLFNVEIFLRKIRLEKKDFILATVHDITERKQTEKALKYRFGFERLIASISTRFVNLAPEEVDREISRALRTIGKFVGVDRSYVFQFDETGTLMKNTHEWHAEGVEPQLAGLQGVPVDRFPWHHRHLRNNETIFVRSVAELGPDARAEKEAWETEGIRSLVVVPMVFEGKLIGFVGFDWVQNEMNVWSEDIPVLLRIVGEIFANALERRQAEENLKEANRELDAFVYTVTHDLRSPLTPIIGFAGFLRENYQDRLDRNALDMLEGIETQGKKMVTLIEDLLALARLEQPQRPAQLVDTSDVVREVIWGLKNLIFRSGLEIKIGLLPEMRMPKTFLTQIFDNLIGNALRYAGVQGGPIEVGGRRDGNRVTLYVRDHGPGIPAEERTRIFEVFCRGSSGRKHPGTGIGLATVQKIARLYEGRAWVDDTPGGGSTFLVEVQDGPSA